MTLKWWSASNNKQRKFPCNKKRKTILGIQRLLSSKGIKKRSWKSKSYSWKSRKYWRLSESMKNELLWNSSKSKKKNSISKCLNKGKWSSYKSYNRHKMFKSKPLQNLNKLSVAIQKILRQLIIQQIKK